MAHDNDSFWNADGSFNKEAYDAEQARVPMRTEVGVGSIWEIDSDKFKGAWKVDKVNPRTIILVDPKGQKLRADIGTLRRTELEFVVIESAFVPRVGMVVTTSSRSVPSVPLVIFKTVGIDMVHAIALGGDENGRYWKLPISSLTQYHGTVTV